MTGKKNKGILMVLSGPSGVGKSTVVKKVLELNNNVKLSVSATTRQKRAGEIDGKDYYFYSKEKFLKLAQSGKMLEYAEYCGNFYGTPKEPVESWLKEGYDVILEIEVEGKKQIKSKYNDFVSVFLLPASINVLYNRLKGRGTEGAAVLEERLNKARKELEFARFYDYLVLSEDACRSAADLLAVLRAEKLKFSKMENYLLEVLKS